MPQPRNIDEIVNTILQDSDDQPDEDYSPVEFAARISCTLSNDEVLALTLAVLRRLPGCLASSILEGLLPGRSDAINAKALYDSIGTGSQLNTSAVVVHLLVGHLGVSPDEVTAELLHRLDAAHVEAVQDRLAFGLWVLFCSETLLSN